MNVTLTVTDLDRLTHALLIAKAMYCCDAVEHTSGAKWQHALRNINALQELYNQLDAALINETVEA